MASQTEPFIPVICKDKGHDLITKEYDILKPGKDSFLIRNKVSRKECARAACQYKEKPVITGETIPIDNVNLSMPELLDLYDYKKGFIELNERNIKEILGEGHESSGNE